MTKKCETGCGFKAEPGMKYCKVCLPKMKRKMREDGYLTSVPRHPRNRPPAAQEDRHETIYGIDD